MTKVKFYSIALLSGAISVSLISCSDDSSEKEQPKEEYKVPKSAGGMRVDTTALKELKLAFYNIDSTLAQWDRYAQATKDSESRAISLKNQMDNELKKVYTDAANYEKKLQERLMGTMPTMEEQNEIQAKGMEFQRREASIQEKFQERIRRATEADEKSSREFNEKFYAFIEEFAIENGFQMIIAKGMGGNLSYGDPRMDVTQDIVDGLNAKYPVEDQSKKEE